MRYLGNKESILTHIEGLLKDEGLLKKKRNCSEQQYALAADCVRKHWIGSIWLLARRANFNEPDARIHEEPDGF